MARSPGAIVRRRTPQWSRHLPRLSGSGFTIAALIFAAGVALTIAVAGVIASGESHRREILLLAEADRLAERIVEHFRDVGVRFRELDELGALIDLSQPEVFDRFAAPIIAHNDAIKVLEWITEVRAGERALVEAQISARTGAFRRFTEFAPEGVREAGERPSYLPVRWIYPKEGNEMAFGLDLASEPRRARTLDHAWRTGRAVASQPLRLVQRPDYLSYLVLVPIRRVERREYLLAIVEPQALLGSSALPGLDGRFSLQVSDTTDAARPVMLTDPESVLGNGAVELTRRQVDFGGRTLALAITGTMIPADGGTGFYRWSLVTGILLSAALAALVAVLVGRNAQISRQVDERTARLQESRERMRQLFMGAPDATIIVDEGGGVEDANEHAEELFGRSRNELLGCQVEDLMPERFRQNHVGQRSDYLHSGRYGNMQPMRERGRFFALHADGREIPVVIGISPLTHGGRRRLIVSLSDLSTHMALTEKLYRERDLRQRSLDALNSILVALDLDGRVTMINRFGCEFVGRHEDELLGINWFEAFSVSPEDAKRDYARIVANFDRDPATTPLIRAGVHDSSGKRHIINWRVSALREGDGRLAGTLASGLELTGQLAAESTARQLAADLEATLNALPDLLLEFDRDYRYRHVHAARGDMLAVPKEKLLGRTVREVVPPDVAGTMEQVLERAMRDGNTGPDLMSFSMHGSTHWADVSASRKVTADGDVRCVLLVRDATKRMLAQRQAEHMRSVVLASGELLAFITVDGRVEVANPAFGRTFDCAAEDVAGFEFGRLVSPAVLAQLEAPLAAGLAGDTQRLPITVGEGSLARTIEVELAPLQRDGSVRGVVLSGHDITDRASAQSALEDYRDTLEREVSDRTAALETIRARLEYTLENNPLATFVLDRDERVVHWNTACSVYFGIAPEDMIGRSDVWRAFYDEERPILAQFLMRGDRLGLERLYGAAGRPSALVEHAYEAEAYFPKMGRWLFFTAVPMFDARGDCIGAIETLQDVTSRKEAEAMMVRAREAAESAARAKSEFLANMSHEIRTPLNGVIGLAQVGVRENAGRRAHHTFDKIHQSAVHLLGLVNDLLDFSKIESGKFELAAEPFDLYEVIDRALDITAPGALAKGISVLVQEAPELPRQVLGDGLRLTQCLVNLLGNAVKFTEHGWVRLDVAIDEGRLCFVIHDTGIGMTEAQVGRLFRPFEQADGSTTRRFGGTGLGLAITQQIVSMMGGEIRVESAAGQGSRFELKMPLRVSEAGAGQVAGLPAAIALVGLMDAEWPLVSAQLSAAGCRCRQLETGGFDLAEDEWLAAPAEILADAAAAGVAETRLVTIHDPGPTPAIGAVHWMRPLRVRRLAETLADGAAPTRELPGQRLPGLRVLGVDDNEINRMVLADLLRLEGATVVLAGSGEEALAAVEGARDRAFDVALLDIEMPGMDGYTLARRLRVMRPALPLVGLTAHASQSDRGKCLAVGMQEHLSKPFDIDRLVDVIGSLTHSHNEPRQETPMDSDDRAGADVRIETDVDMEALLKRFKGRSEFVKRLLGTAVEANGDMSARLVEAVQRQDLEAIRQLAHSIKGMSGNLCAEGVQQTAADVERKASGGDAGALEGADRLAVQVDGLVNSIKQILAR